MGTMRATSIPGGSGTAVVSTDCPGELSHQGPAPGRVELGEDVVEQQGGRQPRADRDQLVHADAQRQRQAPLLALRGVGAGLPAVDGQAELVAVRADGVDAAPHVVTPAGLESGQEVALPAAHVVEGDHDPARRWPGARRPGDLWRESTTRRSTGGDQCRPRR